MRAALPRRGWSILAVSVLLAALPLALGAEDGTATVVSQEMCKGLFLMTLEWRGADGGSHPLTGVFDTGGSSLFIDPDTLESLTGERIESGRRVRMEEVSVAGIRFAEFRPRVRELDHLSLALGRDLDLFVPFQAFDELLLVLDYPRGEMRVRPGGLPEPDGERVFSAKGRDRRPWLGVRVAGRKRKVLVDSGANHGVSLRPSDRFRWRVRPRPLRLAQGMGEQKIYPVGRLAQPLVVGPLRFEEPVVSLTEDTELIGAKVLRHFVVSFDQKSRRLRLDPSVDGPVRMPPRRGTGALYGPGGDAYVIAHLAEGSPAESAGLEIGDRITHIDGVALQQRGCGTWGSSEAEAQRYTVARGEQTIDVLLEQAILVP